MLAMMALGLGQIFGCFYTGFIVDKCGSKFAAKQNLMLLLLALLSVVLYLHKETYLPSYAYLMTFLWGL